MTEIRLEVGSENSVLEILYDGKELRQPPLSMSEQLAQFARKIDFGASENGITEEKDESEDVEMAEEEKPCQQPHWPLEGVRNKIRNAHTEICVLHDLLQMVKTKHNIVLDPVQVPQPHQKPYIQFLSLKKSLSNCSSILISGGDRMRTSLTEARGTPAVASLQKSTQDFHLDLLRLRHDWKLKRVATTIVGDLSYANTNSAFRHNSYFEITKADENSTVATAAATQPSTLPGLTPRASLKVTIPPELEGSAYIFVCIRKDEEDLCSAQLSSLDGGLYGHSSTNKTNIPDTNWQKKLECAQNVLFCKELFSQLAREAVSLKMDIPPLVVADQITSTIFPGIHLLIALCHTRPDNRSSQSNGSCNGLGSGTNSGGSVNGHQGGAGGGAGSRGSTDSKSNNHDGVLEHSLHQLLHDYLHKKGAAPHPVYAAQYAHPLRRVAGPHGLDRKQLMQTISSDTLLEQIIKEAQHNFLRLRTMFVIDQLAMELTDPLIVSHWDLLNSPASSCVRINIVTQGYDSVSRTTLVVVVYEKSLRSVCRDGRVMTMSFEPQELRNLLLCQVAQHQMAAVQSLSKLMGWTVTCSEPCLGIGAAEYLGSASAVTLSAPHGNKQLMVRSGPCTGVTVSVAAAPRNDFYPSAVVQEGRWEQLPGAWQEVRLSAMEGKTVLAKIEMLMAALTAQN